MCMSWKGASQMRKRSGLSRTQFLVQWVVLPVLVIVSAAMFVGLVRNQVSIAAKQQELQSLKNQLAAQVTENAELSGTLDQGEDAIARYAKEIGADAIAHGSTGAGNDQIRFDTFAP